MRLLRVEVLMKERATEFMSERDQRYEFAAGRATRRAPALH